MGLAITEVNYVKNEHSQAIMFTRLCEKTSAAHTILSYFLLLFYFLFICFFTMNQDGCLGVSELRREIYRHSTQENHGSAYVFNNSDFIMRVAN
jgi:hypothetical protein